MNSQFWWFVARSSGIVAWALSAGAVLWGMALATRALGRKPKAPWLLDLHRYLGGLTLAFTVIHMGALVADSYVYFGAVELLVPFTADWKPGPVAWGIVAFYGFVAVELTSLAMKRLPKRLWRSVHLGSYLVFAAATVHLLTAGTDATHPALLAAVIAAVAATVFFGLYRWIGPGRAASIRSATRSNKAPMQPTARVPRESRLTATGPRC